jgi:ankyrin repeat protein
MTLLQELAHPSFYRSFCCSMLITMILQLTVIFILSKRGVIMDVATAVRVRLRDFKMQASFFLRTLPSSATSSSSLRCLEGARQGNVAIITAALQLSKASLTNPNFVDPFGRTALMLASANGHEEVVKALLADERTDVNVAEWRDDKTALFIAAENGHAAVVELLVGRSDPTRTFRAPVLTPPMPLLTRSDEEQSIADLLIGQCEPDMTREGMTVLMAAVVAGQDDVVRVLLAEGRSDPEASTHFGETALVLGASSGHKEVVRVLIADDSVDFHSTNRWGNNGLSCAAANGHKAVVELLLSDRRTNPNATNFRPGRNTALMFVRLRLLFTQPLKLIYPNSTLAALAQQAAHSGHTGVVEMLLADGRADPNLRDFDGDTAFSIAVVASHVEVARLLLADERVNPNIADMHGVTAVGVAASHTDASIMELIVGNRRVDLNLQDQSGRTPLMIAVEKGLLATATALINDERVDPNIRRPHGGAGGNSNGDGSNSTALLAACGAGNVAMAALLLGCGRTHRTRPPDGSGSSWLNTHRRTFEAALVIVKRRGFLRLRGVVRAVVALRRLRVRASERAYNPAGGAGFVAAAERFRVAAAST